METTAFTTNDGRQSLQPLRQLLAKAVTESIDHTAKNAWLVALLAVVTVDVTADESFWRGATDTDGASLNSTPGLIAALTKATSEASKYEGDYKTQLLQDIVDCNTLLTA